MRDYINTMDGKFDPDRCQAITKQGQCINKAVQGTKYCIAHGRMAIHKMNDDKIRNYQLGKWQAKLQSMAEKPNIKSLRDEVAILRMLVEERFNRIQDPMDLVLQSGPISDMVVKIDKIVNSCHKLESQMGLMLDKTSIIQFANEIVALVARVLEGSEEKINLIAEGICKITNRLGEEGKENSEQKPFDLDE